MTKVFQPNRHYSMLCEQVVDSQTRASSRITVRNCIDAKKRPCSPLARRAGHSTLGGRGNLARRMKYAPGSLFCRPTGCARGFGGNSQRIDQERRDFSESNPKGTAAEEATTRHRYPGKSQTKQEGDL